MATKTIDEQIADLQKRQAQLKARKQKLKAKQKEQERKKRTKRLIEVGAEVERYTGCEITDMEAFKQYLERHSKEIRKTQTEQTECAGILYLKSVIKARKENEEK